MQLQGSTCNLEAQCRKANVHPAWLCHNSRLRDARHSSPSSLTAYGSKQPDPVMQGLKDLAGYLAPTVAALTGQKAKSKGKGDRQSDSADILEDLRSPVYIMIAVNIGIFILCGMVNSQGLLLHLGQHFKLWQVVTSGFVHNGGWMHLAETTFITYTFGRLLERPHGALGLWAAYVTSFLGANIFAAWLLPVTKTSHLLAMSSTSAAALGLFVAGLFWPRISRKPLEVLALTPWVLGATLARYTSLSTALVVDGRAVGHLVHVVGAVLGASLVAGVLHMVDLVNAMVEKQRREQERLEAEKQRAARGNDSQAVADVLNTAAKAASLLAKKLL